MTTHLANHGELLGIRPTTPTLNRIQNITAHATLTSGTAIMTSLWTSLGQGRCPQKAVNVGRLLLNRQSQGLRDARQVLCPIDQTLIRAGGSEPSKDAAGVHRPDFCAGFDKGHILFRRSVQPGDNDILNARADDNRSPAANVHFQCLGMVRPARRHPRQIRTTTAQPFARSVCSSYTRLSRAARPWTNPARFKAISWVSHHGSKM